MVKDDTHPCPTMNRTAKWSIAFGGLLAAVAALAAWVWLRPVPVEVAKVAAGHVGVYVAGPGTVQARVPVTVSARLTSTVVGIDVDVGDAVRQGQRLVTLDARDLSARRSAVEAQQESVARHVEAAEAAVDKARADLELALARQRRDADLQTQGFVAPASLETSTAAARAAEAALGSAQATAAARRADRKSLQQESVLAATQLGFAQLRAPMTGIVTQRLAEPGATVSTGTPILRIVDPATLWVATRVDEALVERIRPGQPAVIRLRSGTTLPGKVERVALQSDAATRELDVHVAFTGAPPRVAIDQEAQVRIETGRDSGLVVPAPALVQDPEGRRGVYRVVDGRTRFAPVETGATSEGLVIVRRGLDAGDLVVANAAAARPGMRVRPNPR
jgi:HlyD family secretion protein